MLGCWRESRPRLLDPRRLGLAAAIVSKRTVAQHTLYFRYLRTGFLAHRSGSYGEILRHHVMQCPQRRTWARRRHARRGGFLRTCLRGAFKVPLKPGFPKPPVPRPSPCGTPLSPPLPRPAAYVQHQAWSAVWRSAWLRSARAEPWVWRGRRQVAPGASGGTLPGRSRKKAVCFSYPQRPLSRHVAIWARSTVP
jgi:hypothetical protein